jgi:broad specificity phosphatase PhoE
MGVPFLQSGFHNLVGELARSLGQEFDETGEFAVATASHSPYLLQALRDPPLTALGLEDAKQLKPVAAQLAPQLLVVSPLRRATATILVGFVASAAAVPVVATELCREQMGVHVCDQRFTVADLQAEFPQVDFAAVATNDDVLWQATQRETYPEMADRAYAFLDWLRARPETDIVVGTHSAFLMCLYNVVLDCGGDSDLATFFATGELRSTVLTWEAQA